MKIKNEIKGLRKGGGMKIRLGKIKKGGFFLPQKRFRKRGEILNILLILTFLGLIVGGLFLAVGIKAIYLINNVSAEEIINEEDLVVKEEKPIFKDID